LATVGSTLQANGVANSDRYRTGTEVFDVTQCLAAIACAELNMSAKKVFKKVRKSLTKHVFRTTTTAHM